MNNQDKEAQIKEAFARADLDMRMRQSKIGSVLMLILVPVGISLDYFVYPEHLPDFTLMRLLCDAFIAVILAMHFVPLGQRLIRLLTVSWLMAAVVMIAYMIYLTEGAASSYYGGIALTIVAIGILLPLTVTEVAWFSVISIGIYWLACYLHSGPDINISELFNSFYFLLLASVISTTAVFFSNRRRFNEFRLGYELEQNYEELSQLDKMKSQFFANISHELRTPLGLILAPLQDVQQLPDLKPEVQKFLKVANQNGMRLLRLVNDLLELIRLEEGKQALELQPLRINQLLESQIDAVSHYTQLKGITIKKRLCREDAIVVGDQPAFERIFINLLSNASKFTESGGTIWVSSQVSGEQLIIEIRDTGVGIPKSELSSIFDRFHQVDASSTRKYQGTGIGLALVKELTEKQGGTITVESELGQGTTMRLRYPLAKVTLLEELTQHVAQPLDPLQALNREAQRSSLWAMGEPEDPTVETEDEKVLPTLMIVDDEPGMRSYLVDLLKDSYHIIAVNDGHLALQTARAEKPELMLLDLMLPTMDGLEVCRKLKNDPETERIKIVLLTARVDEAAKIDALKNGANDFLTKPFSSIEVRTRLQNLRSQARLETDLTVSNKKLSSTLSLLHKAQAQMLHEKKLVALGSMAAGLLHEVQNPLSYTLAALHMLKQEEAIKGSAEAMDMLNDVDEGIQRVNRIVADLETFAYPSEVDKQKSFSFREAVKLATRFTRYDIAPVTVDLQIQGDDLVFGSEGHVVQVLVNLLRNSGKVLKDQPGKEDPQLKVIAHEAGEVLRVRVWDNGPGIKPEIQARIFEPFFTTKDVGQGMGLGLSICHTIIKNHGGELKVRSEPGEWTEFYFNLPLAAAADRQQMEVVGERQLA